eukprot:31141-Pelagococcus_subviridis.AAC.10
MKPRELTQPFQNLRCHEREPHAADAPPARYGEEIRGGHPQHVNRAADGEYGHGVPDAGKAPFRDSLDREEHERAAVPT